MIYSDRIKLFRSRNGIKATEIADAIHKSKSLYSEYENEIKTIPTIHLNSICNYLKISFDYIFGFSVDMHYSARNKNIVLDKKIIGNRLKEFRKENNLTQKELGDIVGCSYGTIAGYESGRYLISVPVLYKICKRYKISADYLLGRVEKSKYLK